MTSENPLLDTTRPPPPPCVVVIFGATGDLATRKLLPALAKLALIGELPAAFGLVGVARREYGDEDFHAVVRDAVAKYGELDLHGERVWGDVVREFRYVGGDYTSSETFERLAAVLEEIDRTRGTDGSRLHYLAVPPSLFPVIIAGLGRNRLNTPLPQRQDAFVRIVVEKPYGQNLRTAQDLDDCIHRVFSERQVYRIDHYLGKETVQNILALRFANGVFEPIWNRRYVDSVQITVAEADGIGDRAGFYEQTGALRDVVQNHVMQILALTAMEPPITIEADAIRDEKLKALRAVAIPAVDRVHDSVVPAQYTEGWVAGQRVPAYQDEPGVQPNSRTESYVALLLKIDNWRWAGVPFYVRTGKRLPKRLTEVAIEFHTAPHLPFKPQQTAALEPNALVLHIQPDQGVTLHFGSKVPGKGFEVRSVSMDFHYGSTFPGETADAYERLLLDALTGDSTLFAASDEVLQSWRLVAPIQQAWERHKELSQYPAGTWGPPEADRLLERDGRSWRRP